MAIFVLYMYLSKNETLIHNFLHVFDNLVTGNFKAN
jgi:hypothetical protein